MPATPAKRRRWFRFSLRTLMVAVAVIAILIWIPVKRATEQRQAINTILRQGSRFSYGGSGPATPLWLRRLLGDDPMDSPGPGVILSVSFGNNLERA